VGASLGNGRDDFRELAGNRRRDVEFGAFQFKKLRTEHPEGLREFETLGLLRGWKPVCGRALPSLDGL
jgi:hypothetical protein